MYLHPRKGWTGALLGQHAGCNVRSAVCQAEDKAGKLITSWQKNVIRKERPLLRWLSASAPAEYPSPLDWLRGDPTAVGIFALGPLVEPTRVFSHQQETSARGSKGRNLLWLWLHEPCESVAQTREKANYSLGYSQQNQCHLGCLPL